MVGYIFYQNIEVVISFVVILMMGLIGTLVSDEKNEVAIMNIGISGFVFYDMGYIPVWYLVMIIAGISIYGVGKYKQVIFNES